MKAIRGNAFSMVKDNAVPADPTNSNANMIFAGWYYRDASGGEMQFNQDTVVNSAMTVYGKWNEQQNISSDETLPGDILVGADTEHDAVHEVTAGDAIEYTGRLDVSPVKA